MSTSNQAGQFLIWNMLPYSTREASSKSTAWKINVLYFTIFIRNSPPWKPKLPSDFVASYLRAKHTCCVLVIMLVVFILAMFVWKIKANTSLQKPKTESKEHMPLQVWNSTVFTFCVFVFAMFICKGRKGIANTFNEKETFRKYCTRRRTAQVIPCDYVLIVLYPHLNTREVGRHE